MSNAVAASAVVRDAIAAFQADAEALPAAKSAPVDHPATASAVLSATMAGERAVEASPGCGVAEGSADLTEITERAHAAGSKLAASLRTLEEQRAEAEAAAKARAKAEAQAEAEVEAAAKTEAAAKAKAAAEAETKAEANLRRVRR